MCTSVNECICHGIPDSRQLKDGDIVNIDVTVYLNVSFCDISIPQAFVTVSFASMLPAFIDSLRLVTSKVGHSLNGKLA